MTPISQQLNRTKLKMVELVEELSSFFKLILLTLVEALFIYIFIRVHQPFDGFREHSAFCPMKIAILTIGFSLMFLNTLIVIAFVATQTLAIIRGLKSAFTGKSQESGGSPPMSGSSRKDQSNGFIVGGVGSPNVMITITVVGGSKDIGIRREDLPALTGKHSKPRNGPGLHEMTQRKSIDSGPLGAK